MKCEIKWLDAAGNTTADDNTAIGRVRCEARVEQFGGRTLKFGASRWFYICHHHAQRLKEPGMHDWIFEALSIED